MTIIFNPFSSQGKLDISIFSPWWVEMEWKVTLYAVGVGCRVGPNPHFGKVLKPKSVTHQILSEVSLWVVDHKNTAAYQIWRWGHQVSWGPNPHFGGQWATQKYHSSNCFRSRPIGCRSQKYCSWPNMAVGSSSKLRSKPPISGKYYTPKVSLT